MNPYSNLGHNKILLAGLKLVRIDIILSPNLKIEASEHRHINSYARRIEM
jgi:hypothetical protein